jgi:hypothetical protein
MFGMFTLKINNRSSLLKKRVRKLKGGEKGNASKEKCASDTGNSNTCVFNDLLVT